MASNLSIMKIKIHHFVSLLFIGATTLSIASEESEPKKGNHNFLTIGGGYSPSGNQVSLEKNVLYLQRFLNDLGLKDAPQSLYFADGKDPGRDLQFMDPKFRMPTINKYMAGFVGSSKGLYNQYRTNELETDGASKSTLISKWFDDKGKKLDGDDKLLVYFTGHGGKGEKKKPFNTVMYLWQDKNFRVAEFVKELDKVDKDVPVTMVMVQCYSGGFSHVIFKEGDATKGLSGHTRAGFYSTLNTRLAAGCTPDINEANYREYSTYFWEALYGQTRLGKPVNKPDYDGDKETTFAEAHAYTILKSRTIDIPVKTSDAFLRHFSKIKQPEKGDKVEGLMTTESEFETLLKKAGSCEKAILRGLSKQLELKDKNRGKEARDLAKKITDAKKKINDEKNKLNGEKGKLRTAFANLIKKDWPEVSNPYHPTTRKLLRKDAAQAMIKQIEAHKDFKRYSELIDKIGALGKQVHDEDRKWVKCQRIIRTLENVALEANLPKFVETCTLNRYEELVSAENATL